MMIEERERLRQDLTIVEERYVKVAGIIARKQKFKEEKRFHEKKEKIVPGKRSKLRVPKIMTVSGMQKSDTRMMQHVLKRTIRSLETKKKDELGKKDIDRPKRTGVYRAQKVEATIFPTLYKRGELPCSIQHRNGTKNGLTWVCHPLELDYFHYLPIFVDGIRCEEQPYKFIARQAVAELLLEAQGFPDHILQCIQQIVQGLRLALLTKKQDNVQAALRVIQIMLHSNHCLGEALVPHYKSLLGVPNLFFTKRKNTGDAIHYGQRRGTDIGTTVHETLELLEKYGGPNAFFQIKKMVPAYETSAFCKPLPNPQPLAPLPRLSANKKREPILTGGGAS
mmetsp:Transcript_15087/g.22650  ORF Transcript_15087/g.22650 Transcript_15087/m.22650 type:complete len:337 (+) Transcript_15087:1659-2669(+)